MNSVTGSAAIQRLGEILAEIVNPNRSLEANYRLWMIDTADGQSLSGRLEGETATTVELLDLKGNRHVVPRGRIAGMRASQLSIMPEGLLANLSMEEVRALMAFLRSSNQPRK